MLEMIISERTCLEKPIHYIMKINLIAVSQSITLSCLPVEAIYSTTQVSLLPCYVGGGGGVVCQSQCPI